MDVHELQELMRRAEPHINIVNAFAKTWDVLSRYYAPICSVSGGADSDIAMDIVYKIDTEKKVRYVWFNTGLEYAASRQHLNFLEDFYGITIERIPPLMPLIRTVEQYGQPFLSKLVSYQIHSLQKANFHFSAGTTYEEDCSCYDGRGCKGALGWWHNIRTFRTFNVRRYRALKEFLIEYPPEFPISDLCCTYTKKKPSNLYMKAHNYDLSINGVRQLEGGTRQALKECFTYSEREGAKFRPVFWFTDADKEAYRQIFGLRLSRCYTLYGFKRTGCAGCPYNAKFDKDNEKVRPYEGGLVRVAEKVFAPSYEYTRRFRAFQKAHPEYPGDWNLTNT